MIMNKQEGVILVCGGDGYIGWPLSLKLALTYPNKEIVIADNFSRREQTASVGGDSLIPIYSMEDRISGAKKHFNLDNLTHFNIDVSSEQITDLISSKKPEIIYHLAQQASAPYSMMSSEKALFTLYNNEMSNMRIIWAIHHFCPGTHLIKLGSFGEYAMGGIDVSEGDFRPEYKGKKADIPLPYPRRSDDFYHASKINDSNYLSVATRKWGLKVTEIMQSTIFGSYINETLEFPELYTRYDYDECFGTVLNRFIVQAILGEPLTIYGTGNQRTGLMAIVDSVESLTEISKHNLKQGQHRIINHVTESNFSVNEIAELVTETCLDYGLEVSYSQAGHDPRGERPKTKLSYKIENQYLRENFSPTPIKEVISKTIDLLIPLKERINREVILPKTSWCNRK
jgi:UDP-sulfoquinovose synthase